MGRYLTAAIVTSVVAAVLVAVAVATPVTGVVTATLFARGALTSPVDAKADGIVLRTDSSTDHAVQEIVFGPGSSSGWHRHPGVVLVTIKTGTVVHYDSRCSAETLTAGQTFWESGPHAGLLRNESGQDAVVYVTYILPAGAPLRVDLPNPGCHVE